MLQLEEARKLIHSLEQNTRPAICRSRYEELDETFEKGNAVGVKFPFHEHPLFPTKVSQEACYGCGEVTVERTGGYACDHFRCKKLFVHKGCIKINNSFHTEQPLTLSSCHSEIKCSLCEGPLHRGDEDNWKWHRPGDPNFIEIDSCKVYGYCYPPFGHVGVCKACVRKEPYIYPKKCHEHPLFVLLKGFFSFPCDACGLTNDSSCLCLCIKCCYTIHRHCVDLPRVICINRHYHRIAYVPSLGSGEWKCVVCHKNIDGRYGAYSCSTCSVVSHSRCATRPDVWDGLELEGTPEDDPEEIEPFKVVAKGVIKHFSHEHNLRWINEDHIGYDKHKQCYACVLPIFSGPCYICLHCDFILHETCAKLPRRKRHMSHRKQLTLISTTNDYFFCRVCDQMCNGFAYVVAEDHYSIDVRCVQIYDGYVHKFQPDSILLYSPVFFFDKTCLGCGEFRSIFLTFMGHDDLFMRYRCATLPPQVIYKYDEHPLSLRFSENATGDYWCEICEEKMDLQLWFYTCDECCTTVHVRCLLGIHPYLRVGSTFLCMEDKDLEMEVVRNKFASRPSCLGCKSRIVNASFFHWRSKGFFFCSFYCL